MVNLYMLRANIEAEARILESAEDIAAAEIDPKTKKETHCKMRKLKHILINVKY